MTPLRLAVGVLLTLLLAISQIPEPRVTRVVRLVDTPHGVLVCHPECEWTKP